MAERNIHAMSSKVGTNSITKEENVKKQKSLGVSAAKGVFWVGGGQVLAQCIQMVTAICLARLLVPEDFGLFGMALVITSFSQIFSNFGIGTALVQKQSVNQSILSSCFWLNVMIGGVATLTLVLMAPFLADFYEEDRVEIVLIVLSFNLLLTGIFVVSGSILYKEMRFEYLAKAKIVGSMMGALLVVAMAWFGWGVWSLVAQPMVGSTITGLLVARYAGWFPRWEFSWAETREITKFSLDVFGANILSYSTRYADKLLIGKYLGSEALGYYSMAYQIMLYPMSQISSVLIRVLFPTLSKLQGEMSRFREVYVKAVTTIAFITFPMMSGLFVVSDDFVSVVFGEKWLPMLPVFEVLCMIGMLQSVGTTAGTIHLSTGRTREHLYLLMVSVPITLVAFYIGLDWGILGVATAYAIMAVVFFYARLMIALPIASVTLREFHKALLGPVVASFAMVIGVEVLRRNVLMDFEMYPAGRLAICVIMGVGIYVAVTFVLNKSLLQEIIKLSMSALGRNKSSVAVKS